jgi:hypothetical protein
MSRGTNNLPKNQVPSNSGSVEGINKEQRIKDQFYKGCIESLLMDRKDRLTSSG